MTHLIVFNFHQKRLPGVSDLLTAIDRNPNFVLYDWCKNQRPQVLQRDFETMSLLGNFHLHDRNSNIRKNLDRNLIDFWQNKKDIRRIWITSPIDLHIGLQGMLFGKYFNAAYQTFDAEEFVCQNFDALVWAYEHNSYQEMVPENLMGEKYLTQLQHCENFLRSSFPSRLDFPWAVFIESPRKNGKKWDTRYQVCVPGEMYPSRKLFLSLITSRFSVAPFLRNDSFIRRFFYNLSRVGVNAHIFQGVLKAKIRRANMNWCIKNSLFSYVDGGVTDYFVRKYLEVSALGSVPICPKTDLLTHYGFVQNKHFIEFNSFLEGDYGVFDRTNIIRMQRNLSLLLSKSHTFEARINQLRIFLDQIGRGKVCFASFRNGEFEIQ